jgi:hypothetical protein
MNEDNTNPVVADENEVVVPAEEVTVEETPVEAETEAQAE